MLFIKKNQRRIPEGGAQLCKNAEMYPEQAYVLFIQDKEDEALKILLEHANKVNFDKCITIAVNFKVFDRFID